MRDKINGFKLKKCQSVPTQIPYRFVLCFVCVCVSKHCSILTCLVTQLHCCMHGTT